MSLVALLDIGSTSVSGALFSPVKNKKPGTVVDFPPILFSTSLPVALQDKMDTDRFFADVTQAIKEVLKNLIKSGNGTPKQVICVLSAPFYASRTNVVSKKEEKPMVCTEKLLQSWVKDEIKDFPGHEVLESSILNITLNGYNVLEPFGQSAQEISISHYLSIAPEKMLKQMREAILGVVHSATIQFHSFAFVFFRVLDAATAKDVSYLALEINGEISELSLIWRDALRETASFPLGENWLIRELSAALNLTPEASRSMLRAYGAAHTHDSAEASLEKALEVLRPKWILAFRGALNQALANSFLPRELFLLSDFGFAPIIKKWLEGESWQNVVLGDTNIVVSVVDSVTFASLYNQIPKNSNLSTVIEVIFYDMILNK